MTLKARISLGIGFLLVVILVLSGVSYYVLQNIDERNQQVVNENFTRLDAIETSTSELNKLSTSLLSFDVELNRRALDEFELIFNEKLALVESNRSSASEAYLIENLKSDSEKLVGWLRSEVVEKPADNMEARTAAVTLISQISGALHSLFENNRTAVLLSVADNAASSTFAKRSVLALGILCILFAASILIWLPNYVTSPIRSFGESIKLISEGDYKTRLSSNRNDEFGALASIFNKMAEKLEKSSDLNLDAIIASRNRLHTLVNNLDDSILGIDANRNIVFLNNAMEGFIGLKGAEVMGEYLPDLAFNYPIIQQLFNPIALGKNRSEDAIEWASPDGETQFFQERVIEILTDAGALNGYIIILSNVTDYENRTQRQTDFLAQLSHEMKTPISAINMSLNLLEDERLDKMTTDQKELSGTIRKNSDRLLQMVNEVLQITANKSIDTKLNLDTVQLAPLLEEIISHQDAQIKRKSLDVQLLQQVEGLQIEGDSEKLRLVFDNLLSNAIKHAPDGSEISCTISSLSGGVSITVKDYGSGVPAEFQERLFKKFERPAGDKLVGTSLGLSICKDFIDAHGGRIYLDTTYTDGAAFVVELSRQLPRTLRRKYASF
jgi:PAS domain S-box-containing protein